MMVLLIIRNTESQDPEPEPEAMAEVIPVQSVPHAAAVKWVVDANFRNDHSRARIPDDPAQW